MSTPVKSGPEFLVNTITLGDQYESTITALADGRFVVVWADTSGQGGDGSEDAVKGQIFNADGSKAGGEFLVNSAILDDQDDPVVTALADGGFVVAWTDASGTGDTSGSGIKGRVFGPTGTPAGPEFLVNYFTPSNQYEPTITVLADGRFVVAWTDWGGATARAMPFAARSSTRAARP
jgi:hypothetical protein